MKKLLSLLFSLPFLMFAQSPQGVGYQGVATDLNGVELINQTISIQASILSSSATGNVEWQEEHSVTTDAFGLFALTIGQGIPTGNGSTTNFADISWGSATHFLKIEMDVNGGTNYSHMGTNQMMSVPYALYAENTNINYDSIATILSNDSIFTNSINPGGNMVFGAYADLNLNFTQAGTNSPYYSGDDTLSFNEAGFLLINKSSVSNSNDNGSVSVRIYINGDYLNYFDFDLDFGTAGNAKNTITVPINKNSKFVVNSVNWIPNYIKWLPIVEAQNSGNSNNSNSNSIIYTIDGF
jgi:hypothetical protein